MSRLDEKTGAVVPPRAKTQRFACEMVNRMYPSTITPPPPTSFVWYMTNRAEPSLLTPPMYVFSLLMFAMPGPVLCTQFAPVWDR